MGFSDKSAMKVNISGDPIQTVRPLKWYKPDPTIAYGKNIALTGKSKAGKTFLLCLLGFFREEFRDDIIDAGFDRVVEAMDKKVLPTVHKIVLIESENNLLKALNVGAEREVLQPLIDLDVFEIAPITFERRETELSDKNKVISMRKKEIELCKQRFDLTVRDVIKNEGNHTLFGIDSMTGYKKILDDKLALLYDVVAKRGHAMMDGADTYRQAFYAARNSWWENTMQLLRGYKGWQITTFKGDDTPEQYQKPGQDIYRIKWVNGTEYFLDMVYKVIKHTETFRQIELLNGRYVPDNPDDLIIDYPMNDRMGAMPLIDSMCEKLLLGV